MGVYADDFDCDVAYACDNHPNQGSNLRLDSCLLRLLTEEADLKQPPCNKNCS